MGRRIAWAAAAMLAGCFGSGADPADLRISVTAPGLCAGDCAPSVEFPTGFGGELWAHLYFESGRIVTDQVTWSWNPAVIDLPDGGTLGVEQFVAVGAGTATVTVQTGDAQDTRELTVLGIDALEIDALATTVAVAGTIEMHAVMVASSGNTYDVTGSVAAWTSSDPVVATVADGLVTGLAPGEATITAEYEGVSGSTTVTVTD